MWRNDSQACEAITLLLRSLGLEHLWSPHGPTPQAQRYLQSSPLSSGEQLLLRVAFDLWGGHGQVKLYDMIGTLDSRRTVMALALVAALSCGSRAVDQWIADQKKEVAA